METIRVIVKARPTNSSVWMISPSVIKIEPSLVNELQTEGYLSLDQKTSFPFDGCYENAENRTIYEKHVHQIVEKGLSGINGTVFMYGQTGSGKTYTMLGSNREKGVIDYSVEQIFSSSKGNKDYMIKCQYVEIYQDICYDLLGQFSEPLSIVEDRNKEF